MAPQTIFYAADDAYECSFVGIGTRQTVIIRLLVKVFAMTAPILMNAVQIAWLSLLGHEQITGTNIEAAPLRLLAAIMQASTDGESVSRDSAQGMGRGAQR